MFSRSTIATLAALAVASCGPAVHGQYQEQVRQIQLKPVEFKGTVDEVAQGVISVKTADKTIYLKIDPNATKVQCNGTAERTFLKPGVLVRFSAEFDKRGQAQGTIDQLSVVTPSEAAQPGIHSDAVAGFGGEEEQPRRKPKANEGGTFVVVGTVKLLKDNQLQVVAAGKQVRIDLAEKLDIVVDVDDYSWAQNGDEISVRARMADGQEQAEVAQALGDEVTITFAKPLAAASKGGKKKPVKRPAK